MKEKDKFTLDTSALFTLMDKEAGYDKVESLLGQARHGDIQLYIAYLSYLEVYYKTWQGMGESAARYALGQLNQFPLHPINLSEEIILIAGKFKALFPLSPADACIAATAVITDSTLVHKDPEFEPLKNELSLLPLPYKARKA